MDCHSTKKRLRRMCSCGQKEKVAYLAMHVPRELSRLFWHFLQHNGEITHEITNSIRQSPLVQGSLELSFIYKFVGKKKHTETLQIID